MEQLIQRANHSDSGKDHFNLAMEGLVWEGPFAAATLLNSLGLPPAFWSSTVENSREFLTASDSAADDYQPQLDVANNSMESGVEERMVDGNKDLVNKFFYNAGYSFSMSDRSQEEEMRVPPNGCYLNRASIIQEQLFDPPVLPELFNCLISSTNSTMNASVEDDGISSQAQIVERENSAITSNIKGSWTVSWSGVAGGSSGAISSESTEQDEAASQSCHLTKKRKSPERSTCCFSLEGENYLSFDAFGSKFLADGGHSSGEFQLVGANPLEQKKPKSENPEKSTSINFMNTNFVTMEPDTETIAAMKEMIYRAAALRPISAVMENIEKPKRKNVRISTDPQTVAARQRRERISDRIRILQRLVPGGTKMDTATMLDEAANYLKFLKSQVAALQSVGSGTTSINYHQ